MMFTLNIFHDFTKLHYSGRTTTTDIHKRNCNKDSKKKKGCIKRLHVYIWIRTDELVSSSQSSESFQFGSCLLKHMITKKCTKKGKEVMKRGKQNSLHRKKRGIDMNQCAAAKEGAKAYELAAAFCLLIHKLRRTSSIPTCCLYEYPIMNINCKETFCRRIELK